VFCEFRTNVFVYRTNQTHHTKYICSRTSFIRTLVIRITNFPDRFGPSVKFVYNSRNITCLEIIVYSVKYVTVLLFLELEIRQCRKVYTEVHTANRTAELRSANGVYFQRKLHHPGFLHIRVARRPSYSG